MEETPDVEALLYHDQTGLLTLRVGPDIFSDNVRQPQGAETLVAFAAQTEEERAKKIRIEYTAMNAGIVIITALATLSGVESFTETRNPLYLLGVAGLLPFSCFTSIKSRKVKQELSGVYEARAEAARNVTG